MIAMPGDSVLGVLIAEIDEELEQNEARHETLKQRRGLLWDVALRMEFGRSPEGFARLVEGYRARNHEKARG